MKRPMINAVHIDYHTMPGIHDFLADWDAERFAEILAEADVRYINAFARCNIGFAYYPTRVGIPYPGMKQDMLGELLDACHKRDIGVSAYINVGLDHGQAILHPDWLRLDQDGRIIRGDRTGNFFRTLCYNNSDYQRYHEAMLEEILAYDVDGMFFDCMVVEPCFCPHCRRRMKAEGINPDDIPANKAFQERSMFEFARAGKKAVGPDKYLYMNGLDYSKLRDVDTHVEIECLPGRWGYDFFWPSVSYARTLYREVIYMTGRFQESWGDFGGFKGKASLEYDYADALSAGVEISVGDHMHPARNLDSGIYRVVGELHRRFAAYEPWTRQAAYLAEIGVAVNAEVAPEIGARSGIGLSDSYAGLARMLGELRYGFNIVNENQSWAGYPLIILPDDIRMNPTMKKRILDHLAAGGKILSTGVSGLDEAKQAFISDAWSFQFNGLDTSNSGYFQFTDPVAEDGQMVTMDQAMYSKAGVLFSGEDPLATRVAAYFDRHWDGLHAYYYRPPVAPDGNLAAAASSSGQVIQISFQIFLAYNKAAYPPHKELLRRCLERLLPNPAVRADTLPSTARVHITEAPGYRLVHIKTTYPELRGHMSVIEEANRLPAGAALEITGMYSGACILPEEAPVTFTQNDGFCRLELPQIDGYVMIRLDKAES